jgi:hypothetical protein
VRLFETFEVELTEEDFTEKVKSQRVIAVLGTITLYMKASYFLSLIDSVAPLIDIIFRCLYDIKWFLGVMMFYIIMLGNCFSLLARNQIDFDNLTEEEIESIPYYGREKFN